MKRRKNTERACLSKDINIYSRHALKRNNKNKNNKNDKVVTLKNDSWRQTEYSVRNMCLSCDLK